MSSRILQRTRSIDPYIVAASVAANGLSLALPLLMLQVYDRVIPNRGIETLTVLIAGVTLAIVLEMVLRTARAQLAGIAGERYERVVVRQLFERLLKSDIAAVESRSPGEYLDSVTGVDRVRDFRNGETAMAVLDLPFAFVFLGVVIVISPALAVVIVVLLLLSLVIMRRLQTYAHELGEKKHDIDRRRYSFLIEVLHGIESIKSSNLEAFMERRYERLTASSARVGAEAAQRGNFVHAVSGSIGQVTPVVIAAAGAVLVIEQVATVGALAAVILLGTRIIQPVLKIEALWAADVDTKRAERDIDGILALPMAENGNAACPRIEAIALSHIHVARADGPLFCNLNLTIERGEIIALDGASGSGRSSLLWLMMGYLQCDSGAVTINGLPFGGFDQGQLRSRIAYLPPNPTLLEGTVLDNMTRFQPELFLDDALEVAAALGLEEYFAAHQEGLTTRVGQGRDAGLPTSIAERVPLVGALVGKPDLLLFDEANANLDIEGDSRLREYLASLKGKAAVVMVTQRPSYIALADRRLVLADGVLSPVPMTASLPSEQLATRVAL